MTKNDVINYILDEEQGYVNDPEDPGGETNWGISKRSYPHLNIKSLTRAEAFRIYETDYWAKMHGHHYDIKDALIIVDCAVNQGRHTATVLLQTILGVQVDGVIGPKTLSAYTRKGLDYSEFAAQRMVLYGNNKKFKTYGKGWSRRLMRTVIRCAQG